MLDLTFVDLVAWIIQHGYFIFFFTALIEGPVVTTAAGVAAALGYFNIYTIILVAICGDLTADIVYYFIGYHSRNIILERYGYIFGLTKDRMERVGEMMNKNFKKTMLVVKLSPLIPIPGLIAIGASRAPIKKFIGMSLLVTIPRSLLFSLLGFYSGKTYVNLGSNIISGTYALGLFILVIFIIYFIYQKITTKIIKKVDF